MRYESPLRDRRRARLLMSWHRTFVPDPTPTPFCCCETVASVVVFGAAAGGGCLQLTVTLCQLEVSGRPAVGQAEW